MHADVRQFAETTLAQPVTALEVLIKRATRTVYRAHTQTGTFVVKVDAGAGAFEREVEALKVLSGSGFPVQQVIAVRVGPPALLLLPWTHGNGLSESSGAQVAGKVGELLGHLHALPGHVPPPGSQTWAAWMFGWLQHASVYWQKTGHAPIDAWPRLSAWFTVLQPLLLNRGEQLILFDGRPEHFIISPEGEPHLIDVAELRAGDGLMDLAVIGVNDPDLLPAVLRGYRPLGEAELSLLDFYQLLRALAAAEWDETELSGRQRDRFLNFAAGVLKRLSE